MEKAAFFDIDGTLYREGLITEVFKKLVKYEIIPSEKWYNEVRPEYNKWDKRQGNYDNYLLKMAEIYKKGIIGLHKSQVEFIAKNVVVQKGDRVYTFTRDRIKWHMAMGHKLIVISGSPIELVSQMAIKYGFHDYVGSVYTLNENDTYTGEVIPMWDSVSKEKAINKFIEKYEIDLRESYAYGDTAGDTSMLKKVGYPYAINPTKELITEIMSDEKLKDRAKIIVERKDVIYQLDKNSINIL